MSETVTISPPFMRRFRRLQQRMMAVAQAEGIDTDEDVFTRVS